MREYLCGSEHKLQGGIWLTYREGRYQMPKYHFPKNSQCLVILQPQLFLIKTKIPRLSEGVPWIVNLDNIWLLFLIRDVNFCWSRWWSIIIKISLFVLSSVWSLCASLPVPSFIPRMFVLVMRIFERLLLPEKGFFFFDIMYGRDKPAWRLCWARCACAWCRGCWCSSCCKR